MPIPTDDQILIKVKAAGINRSDVITRKKKPTHGKGVVTTIIPCLEVSGINAKAFIEKLWK